MPQTDRQPATRYADRDHLTAETRVSQSITQKQNEMRNFSLLAPPFLALLPLSKGRNANFVVGGGLVTQANAFFSAWKDSAPLIERAAIIN